MGKHTKDGNRTYGDGKGAGYKNVSAQHQWKKGDPSPNPKGRPKKPEPSLSDDGMAKLLEVFNSKMTASGPKGPTEVEVWDMVMRRIANDAIHDGNFALKVLKVRLDHSRSAPQSTAGEDNWADEDDVLIRDHEAKLARQLAARATDRNQNGSNDDE